MDEITSRIRDMYEQFPYPAGNPVNRVGNDVDLALSYQALRPERKGPAQVLDAGCGRGLGILGAATLQPKVRFLGVDINRVALAEATAAAKQRGLQNASFQESDLMQLDGFDVPPGGFDMVHSSGVIHHLSDPATGLARLREVLAPHGVINLMVYAKHGREPLMQTAEAISQLLPDDMPLQDKVQPAREVAALAKHHVLAGTVFENTLEVNDVEFVDRLLNVNETSYDIPKLSEVLEAAGLRFLRWIEPADWSPAALIPEGQLLQKVDQLDEFERYRFIELIFRPAKMECLVCRADNGPRPELQAADIESTQFRLNPEVVIGTSVRQTPAGSRVEKLELILRTRDAIQLAAGPFASALMAVKELDGMNSGANLLKVLRKAGLSEADGRAVVLEMVRQEVFYRTW